MAQPPGAAAAADRQSWVACVLAISRLPAVGSEVYYFPGGHSEQCPPPLPPPPAGIPFFPCTVTGVELITDREDPYATISLLPGPHTHSQASAPDDGPSALRYYHKVLTRTDTSGNKFLVPKPCEFIFPRLPEGVANQELLIQDLRGQHWKFVHENKQGQHSLSGWRDFVEAKVPKADGKEPLIFMRRPDGQLLLEVRVSADASNSQNAAPDPPLDAPVMVPHQEVADAVRLAAQGTPFTVTYYPRAGRGEFVVPRKVVDDALNVNWVPGKQVHMRLDVVNAKEVERPKLMKGIIMAVHPSIWRMLKIDWDDSTSSSSMNNNSVNVWQVDIVEGPPVPKKPRTSQTTAPLRSGDVTMAGPSVAPQSQSTSLTSIKLFGTIITTPVQSAIIGSSEVNPIGVVDGTANEDACATNPIDCSISKDDGHNQHDSSKGA